MNYYDILGVARTASQDEIKRAYREQIKFFHPDVFEGPPEVARLKTLQLNEAYAVLHDPQKRREYDFQLEFEERRAREEARAEAEAKRRRQAEETQRKRREEERKEQEAEAHRARQQAQEQEANASVSQEAPTETAKKAGRVGVPRWIVAVLGALCVVLLVCGVQFYQRAVRLEGELAAARQENAQMRGTTAQQTETIRALEAQVEQLEAECADLGFSEDFLTVAVGLIWDNDPVYFHQPDCTAVNGANFSVFAEDICESVGLKPCPVCYTEEDVALIEQWKEW